MASGQSAFAFENMQQRAVPANLLFERFSFRARQAQRAETFFKNCEQVTHHPNAVRRETPRMTAVTHQRLAMVNDSTAGLRYSQPQIEVFTTTQLFIKHAGFANRTHTRGD